MGAVGVDLVFFHEGIDDSDGRGESDLVFFLKE